MSDGVHVGLEDVVGRQLRDAAIRTFVALLEGLGSFRPRLAGQHEPQAVALDVLTPNLGDLLVRRGPRQLASIPLEGLVERVVGLGGEQRDGGVDALAGAFTKQIEDVEDRLQVAGARAVVELVAQPIEACDVGRREIHAVAVELIEILIEDRRRQGVVEARQRVVKLLDQLRDVGADRERASVEAAAAAAARLRRTTRNWQTVPGR